MKHIHTFESFLNESLNESASNFKVGDKVKHVGKNTFTQFSKMNPDEKGGRIYGEVEVKDGDELVIAKISKTQMGDRIVCTGNFKGFIFTHDNEGGKNHGGVLPL